MTLTKSYKNYLVALPIKQKFKDTENPKKIMEYINEIKIETENQNLKQFYNNLIMHIYKRINSPIKDFDLNSYGELRANISTIDEEFIEKYGDTILDYINMPKYQLDEEIRSLDKIYNFSSREERMKKTIIINGKPKDIYVRDKRPIKDYDILLYLNETLGLMKHFLSKNIDSYLSAFSNETKVYDNFYEHEEIIYDIIRNSFEEKFGYLKNTNIKLLADCYEYFEKNLNKKILETFRMIAQSSKFRENDPYFDYANYSKAKCICIKLKKDKKLNRFKQK